MKIVKTNRELGKNGLFACPCCGYATLGEVAYYEICEICFWEDDGQDNTDAEINYGGANKVSLAQGRINFLLHGASDLKDIKHVRKPQASDINLRGYYLQDGKVVKTN
jgi:hypothetical protein